MELYYIVMITEITNQHFQLGLKYFWTICPVVL